MTTKCCKCDKVRIKDEWIKRMAFPEERFSFGYCPECLGNFRREIWRERRAARLELAVASPAV